MTPAIRQWLDQLGLSQYAEAFATNDIDIELLAQLTDQVLEYPSSTETGDGGR